MMLLMSVNPIFEVLAVEEVPTVTGLVLLRVRGTWRSHTPTTLATPRLMVQASTTTANIWPLPHPGLRPPRATPDATHWAAGYAVPGDLLPGAGLALVLTLDDGEVEFPLRTALSGSAGPRECSAFAKLMSAELALVGHTPEEIERCLELLWAGPTDAVAVDRPRIVRKTAR